MMSVYTHGHGQEFSEYLPFDPVLATFSSMKMSIFLLVYRLRCLASV